MWKLIAAYLNQFFMADEGDLPKNNTCSLLYSIWLATDIVAFHRAVSLLICFTRLALKAIQMRNIAYELGSLDPKTCLILKPNSKKHAYTHISNVWNSRGCHINSNECRVRSHFLYKSASVSLVVAKARKPWHEERRHSCLSHATCIHVPMLTPSSNLIRAFVFLFFVLSSSPPFLHFHDDYVFFHKSIDRWLFFLGYVWREGGGKEEPSTFPSFSFLTSRKKYLVYL